jgi:hypothetical protein
MPLVYQSAYYEFLLTISCTNYNVNIPIFSAVTPLS